jgi:hypothetical protein
MGAATAHCISCPDASGACSQALVLIAAGVAGERRASAGLEVFGALAATDPSKYGAVGRCPPFPGLRSSSNAFNRQVRPTMRSRCWRSLRTRGPRRRWRSWSAFRVTCPRLHGRSDWQSHCQIPTLVLGNRHRQHSSLRIRRGVSPRRNPGGRAARVDAEVGATKSRHTAGHAVRIWRNFSTPVASQTTAMTRRIRFPWPPPASSIHLLRREIALLFGAPAFVSVPKLAGAITSPQQKSQRPISSTAPVQPERER